MLCQVHFPEKILTDELDRYLADGWFRMGQTIFTTNFLSFNKNFYSAVWLRVSLSDVKPQQSFEKLKKVNSTFQISVQPAQITPEKEDLFSRYRREVSFEASPSLHHLMFGKDLLHNVFRTYEVTIRDQGKLIGCGFFDVGKLSAAGISSFYDPEYKKNSLGKYIIFLKIDHCVKNGLRYFYPGYFVPGYPAFDYKLKIHNTAIEYLQLRTGRWDAIKGFSSTDHPIMVMRDRLTELQEHLSFQSMNSSLLYYEYYDANLVHDLSHMELFDYPVFLHYYDEFEKVIQALVVYDVRDQSYHWLMVRSLWTSEVPTIQESHFSSHLLKVEQDLLRVDSASQLAPVLRRALKR